MHSPEGDTNVLRAHAQVFPNKPSCPNWGTLALHINATLFA